MKAPLAALLLGAIALGGCAAPGRVPPHVPLAPFPAVALAVESGDVLVLRHARTQRIVRLRLEGVDAPEADQPHAAAALAALRTRVAGASLVVTATGFDPDGSLSGWLCTAEAPYFTRWSYPACGPEESVNLALIEDGAAWSQPAAAPPLAAAQTRAQGRRAGLWRGLAPVPPWQWRAMDDSRRAAILGAEGRPAAGAVAVPAGDYAWLFGGAAAESPAAHRPGPAWTQALDAVVDAIFPVDTVDSRGGAAFYGEPTR